MDETAISTMIAEELNLRWNQVKNTIELLDAGNTIAFIARYRKEATGSLDEEIIRSVELRVLYIRNLEDRKKVVLKSIDEQGKLTPELEAKIKSATKLQQLEDLYLPYKPKKRTRATIARERGLEPLALKIFTEEIAEGDRLIVASEFINEEKEIVCAEDAIAGAKDIIAEIISDDSDIRAVLRKKIASKGIITTAAKDSKNLGVYEMYESYVEPITKIPSHRILAINRAEKEKIIRVDIEVPKDELVSMMEQHYIKNPNSIFTEDLREAIKDSYQRLLFPAMERELRAELTTRADEKAITVFAENLRHLLMSPPLNGKKILGIDPGFRTGCKIAVIDETGKYLDGDTMYPHEPQRQWIEAKELLEEFIDEYTIDIIAIGNGTASRETELLVSELLSEIERKVVYVIVSEAGASVYSASQVAREEFPDLEASMRGNISIARRLLDPLSELVKIDPKSIGVGQYQHDVDQKQLSGTLDFIVESCVNKVGVNLNTASVSLLQYVAGLNKKVAKNIVEFREEKSRFISREELHEVKGLGPHAFVQAAGFLRIPNAEVFFDSTAVHPESYNAASALLEELEIAVDVVKKNGAVVINRMKERGLSLEGLAQKCDCGVETLTDIIDSLEKPDRDPRENMPKPIFRQDVLKIEQIRPGMILTGTVRNVVDFGAFVDIGVKQDGLVHLSKMAQKYVKNPFDIVSVGDIVEVKVLEVDVERERISLSMVLN